MDCIAAWIIRRPVLMALRVSTLRAEPNKMGGRIRSSVNTEPCVREMHTFCCQHRPLFDSEAQKTAGRHLSPEVNVHAGKHGLSNKTVIGIQDR